MQASRLPSQLYIATPLLAGQAYAGLAGHPIDWPRFWLVQGFGLFIQLFIVYANDVADRETDRLNATFTLFSGGSRVLVDGELTPGELKRGAVLSAGLALACCAGIGFLSGAWLVVALGVASILLLLAYSFPPVRLNYRGGGELLQMIGTGLILPVFGWTAQTGTLLGFPLPGLMLLLPTMLACAIGTCLPDEPSDRLSGKNSAAVLLGPRTAQVVTVLCHGISLAVLIGLCPFPNATGPPLAPFLAALLFIVLLTQLGGKPGSARLFRFGLLSISLTLAVTLASPAWVAACR